MFQIFLTTFLIDSGYKTPIQNVDELFTSGIKLGYLQGFSQSLYYADEMDVSKLRRNYVDCLSFRVLMNWVKYQSNVSFLMSDFYAEFYYANGALVGQNSEPLFCKLKDGVFNQASQTMLMLHIDPLMRRVTEFVGRVVEAGI